MKRRSFFSLLIAFPFVAKAAETLDLEKHSIPAPFEIDQCEPMIFLNGVRLMPDEYTIEHNHIRLSEEIKIE